MFLLTGIQLIASFRLVKQALERLLVDVGLYPLGCPKPCGPIGPSEDGITVGVGNILEELFNVKHQFYLDAFKTFMVK